LKATPIYVETFIKATLDQVWAYTQNPEKHQIWDLRFSEIKYLPKRDDADPQRFLYRTKIGFGVAVSGYGESVRSQANANGECTSSLKFGSAESISLIEKGSGYWQYIPQPDGVRFLTWYDYTTRFGLAGRMLDRLLFRPLMRWATAWSFDALRLWLEEDIHPTISFYRLISLLIANATLAIIWFYHGLVPKLLFTDTGELALLAQTGIAAGYETQALTAIGYGEIMFALLFIAFLKSRYLHLVNIVLLVLLTAGAIFSQPYLFAAPFNPVTLNAAMIGLSLIGINSLRMLPQAGNCLRERNTADSR
jgi:hypothetical protein